MDHLAVAGVAHRVAAFQHMTQIAVADLASANGDLGLDHARSAKARREADHGLIDGFSGHLLGGVHGGADRIANLVEVDDHPALHAARDLMTDPEDARLGAIDPGDKATDFGRTDIDAGDEAATRPHRSLSRPWPRPVA